MLRRLLLATTALTMLVTPASAAPLAAAIAAIPAIAALGSTAAGLIGWGVVTGLAVAGSLLLAPKTPSPTPADVASLVKQDVPVRWVHQGRRRVGGAMLLGETEAGNFHGIYANQHGLCEAFERTFLDGREVVIDGGTGFVIGVLGTGEFPFPNPYTVQIITRPGTADQTAIGEPTVLFPTLWTAEHRARGVALTYIRQGAVEAEAFGKAYPNRLAQIEQIGRFGQAYDPRTEATVWTQNLPLLFAAYLTSPDGMQIPAQYINMPRLAAAADRADEEVAIKGGGTIPRYHGGFSYRMDADPASIVARYLAAMDGRLSLLPDGTIAIDAGAYEEPTVVLDNDSIVGYELRAGGDPANEANEIRAQFTYAGADYAAGDADAWRDEADIAESGEAKPAALQLYEVEHHNHCRRLMKLYARRVLPAYQGTVTTNLKGLEAWDQRFVRIRGTLYGLDHVFEVQGFAFDPATMTVTLQVVAMTASAWSFDAETEEGTAPALPDEDDATTIGPPEGLSVTRAYRTVSGGVRAPVLEVSWNPPLRAYSSAQAQISVSGADSWRDIALVRNTSPPTAALAENVSDGTDYDIRVRWRAPDTDWSTIATETAVADPDPAGDVTGVSATPDGTGAAVLGWFPPNSARYAGVKIRGSTTDDIGTASVLDTVSGAPTTAFQTRRLTSLAAGTWYFWVSAVNGSGIESDPEPSGATTIT
jgi:hypothetical protein